MSSMQQPMVELIRFLEEQRKDISSVVRKHYDINSDAFKFGYSYSLIGGKPKDILDLVRNRMNIRDFEKEIIQNKKFIFYAGKTWYDTSIANLNFEEHIKTKRFANKDLKTAGYSRIAQSMTNKEKDYPELAFVGIQFIEEINDATAYYMESIVLNYLFQTIRKKGPRRVINSRIEIPELHTKKLDMEIVNVYYSISSMEIVWHVRNMPLVIQIYILT